MNNAAEPSADHHSPTARVAARLQRWGMGARVLKTTLAVVLAWELGTHIPGGTDHPYFAPLAALLSFQITVADSITAVVQRIMGIVLGVIVAFGVSYALGETVWGIGLLVFLALVLGANLHLNSQGVAQVATSALIVMFVGGAGNLAYAGARIAESIVGAVVGIAVNALLVPPTYLPEAQRAVQQLSTAVAQTMATLAAALADGLSPEQAAASLAAARALNGPFAAAQAAVERAATSLKYNPLRRTQHSELIRYRNDLVTLEHPMIQVRTLTRILADSSDGTLNWRTPSPLGNALSLLLAALAQAIRHSTDSPASGEFVRALAEGSRQRAALVALQTQTSNLTPTAWMHLGVLLATTDRMQHDLGRRAKAANVAELA